MRLLHILFLLFLFTGAYAQRNCATMEVLHEQLLQNPALGQQMQAIEQHNQHYHQQLGNQLETRTVITIPVVFHIVHNGDPVGSNENLPESLILAQLEQLNLDLALLNSDASLIPPLFQPVAANTEIQFCLAQRRPDGSPTDGINRVQYSQASWTTSQINSTLKPATIWDRDQYLNVWTVVFGGSSSGLLGFAQFPGGNPNTDGVVVAHYSVGSVANPHPNGGNYNKGRTLTHEVGHWLNLRHIWGDATCGNDFVADTPVHQTSNNGCPVFPKTNNCPGGPWTEMTMNYMDYTYDACMYMFTNGQKNRMQAVLAPGGARFSLNNSLGCVPPGGECAAPALAQLNASEITANSARLNCTVSGVNAYDWRYRAAGTTAWTELPSTAAAFTTISGLAASTTYEFQAMVQCGTVWSAWSPVQTFTTLADACPAPAQEQLAVSNLTPVSARLNCSVFGVNAYDWRYRQVGATGWTELPSTATNFTDLGGLTPSTTYEFQAMVQCGTVWSAWSVSFTFSTPAPGPCNAPLPGQYSATEITSNSARFNCTVTGVNGYLWRFRELGSSNWTELPSTTENFTYVYGLPPNTRHEMQVSLICINAQSAWSGSFNFSTIPGDDASCTAPQVNQLSALDITTTTASLNCSLTGVSAYNWRYRATGSSAWVEPAPTTSGTIPLAGLSPATTYEFQVAVQCTSGQTSPWSGSQTFVTEALPTCAAPAVSQLFASDISSGAAQLNCSLSGVSSYTWRYRQVGTSDWLTLPSTSGNFVVISGLSASTAYEFEVLVLCSNGIASDWSDAQTFSTGGAVCTAPTVDQISATNITAFSARLNCSVSGVSAYQWRYRVVGAPAWIELGSSTAGFFDLANLSASTNYEFQAAVQCGSTWSNWSGSKSFSTPAPPSCTAPTARMMYAVQITSSSARLYNSAAGATQYHWRYRPSGTGAWATPSSTSIGFIDVAGLSPGTNYEFQGAISCGAVQSDWSPSGFFTTLGSTRTGVAEALEVHLSPVPARSFINVQFQLPEAAFVTFAAVDITGRTVLLEKQGRVEAGAHTRNIGLQGLPAGVYVLQMQAGRDVCRQIFIVSGE